MSEEATRQAMARAFGTALRLVRGERGLSQKVVHEQSGIPTPMLSGYEAGRQRPHEKTLNKLIDALRNLRVPEDRLARLREVWEGKTPATESAEPQTPPPAQPRATDAKADEPTPTTPVTPSAPAPGPVAAFGRAVTGEIVLTVPIPASFSVAHWGKLVEAIMDVFSRYSEPESGS